MPNKLVVTLLVFIAAIGALVYFRDQITSEREAARVPAVAPPAAPALTLEQRAAAAQGTVYPVQKAEPPARQAFESKPPSAMGSAPPSQTSKYACDGRRTCPQMHSCEEAKWFLQHCSGMKMDGDGDGIPCEDQWCPQ